jgi:hypothetical protein
VRDKLALKEAGQDKEKHDFMEKCNRQVFENSQHAQKVIAGYDQKIKSL